MPINAINPLQYPVLGRTLGLSGPTLWLFASTLFAPFMVAAAPVPFSEPPVIATGLSNSFTATAGDLDGDGDLDVIAAATTTGSSRRVAWYENTNGDGSAWSERLIAEPNSTRQVVVGDLDGDGDLDVVSANFYPDHRVNWYENTNGDASAWTSHNLNNLLYAYSVALGDIDGDGDLDVLATNRVDASLPDAENTVVFLENTVGDASSWTPTTLISDFDGATSAALADVDGDGDLDGLAVAEVENGTATWFENTAGDGSTWIRRDVASLGAPTTIRAADMDNDGDQDLLIGARRYTTLGWYENLDGDGLNWQATALATSTVSWLEAVDMDQDGDRDVLVNFGATVGWYDNDGGAGTWVFRDVKLDALSPSVAVAADLDDDGDPDVLTSSRFGDVNWYRNDTLHRDAGFRPAAHIASNLDGAIAVALADLDGDGDLDATAAGYDSNAVRWFQNDNGAWTEHSVNDSLGNASAVVTIDLDRDRDTDLLASGASADRVRAHRNTNGAGTNWNTTRVSSVNDPRDVAAGDVDGDGDPDAVVAAALANTVAWYANNGSGGGWAAGTIDSSAAGARAVSLGDLDRDGDLDAVAALGAADRVVGYRNGLRDAAGWSLPITLDNATSDVRDVALADIDGDGDLDALSAAAGTATVAWHSNDAGDASLWSTWPITTSASGVRAVDSADLDQDGDTDVIAAALLDDTVSWFENLAGDGLQWHPATVTDSAAGARAVASGDIDGDGDLDLLVASYYAGELNWFENCGGQFAIHASQPIRVVGQGTEVAILRLTVVHRGRPGDGDLELRNVGLRLEASPGVPLSSAEANALIDTLRLYRDTDANRRFDNTDTLMASLATLDPGAAIQLSISDDNPDARVAATTGQDFFVVAQLSANAAAQTPNTFRISHLGNGSVGSGAEDATHDIALAPSCPVDFAGATVAVAEETPEPLIFLDDFE